VDEFFDHTATNGGWQMNKVNSDNSTASSKNAQSKNRFDAISKVVAISGGLISAIAIVISLKANTDQRASELRWNQARLAAELEDDMFVNDPQVFNALRMIDWGAYNFTIKGTEVTITREEVQQSLNVEKNNELNPKDVFVRESFDRLFYRMGKLERAVRSELVLFEDVVSPMSYYVPFLLSTHRQVLEPYMRQLHHTDALTFMKRFDSLGISENSQPMLYLAETDEEPERAQGRTVSGRRSAQRSGTRSVSTSERAPERKPAKEDAEVFVKVRDIVVEQLGVDGNEVMLNSSFVNELGADSLDLVELTMAIEEEFGIEIPDEVAELFKTMGDVTRYLGCPYQKLRTH
jgi:acyl carrier protein